MTCAMQAVEPLQDWKTIFPDFTTLTGSCQFIKKLMAVSLSSITYIRGVFPEKAYGERHLCGIKLKLLTEDSGIEAVNKFINLIRSCYDAVENKYLHQLNIGICLDAENKDNVIEAYNICFRYRDDEYSVTCNSNASSSWLREEDPTVTATLWLLKSIVAINDILEPLPQNAYLTMKLLYNDEITPPDYEPPGFEPSDCEKFSFTSSAVKLELGKVSTNIHGYKMYLKTSLSKEPLNKYLEESLLSDTQNSSQRTSKKGYIPETMQDSASGISPNTQNVATDNDDVVSCLCNCKRQDPTTAIIQCTACMRKQHSVCYGILRPEESNFDFYCVLCMREAPFSSTQDLVYSYHGKEQHDLCTFRRALVVCASLKQVSPTQLEKKLGCNKETAKDLTERLEFEGFIKKIGNRQKYTVNDKKIINNGYQQYFLGNENKENSQKVQKSRLSKTNVTNSDMDGTNVRRKQSSSSRETKSSYNQNSFMDIDEEVEKLQIKGPFEKHNQLRRSSRRSYEAIDEDNDLDEFESQPKKKRCQSIKKVMGVTR